MNKLYLLLLIAFFLFSSCDSRESYSIFVYFGNVEGLKNDSEVQIRGIEAGEIKSMKLHKDGVLVGIDISNQHNIPNNSIFKIRDNSILGPKILDIHLGDSMELLKNNDTITGEHDNSSQKLDFNEEDIKRLTNELDQARK